MKTELHFHISNFKSIRDANLTVRKGLNILIGPNGAGKTCLFSAIRFIKDVVQLGSALAIAKAGGPKRAYNHNSDKITMSLIFDYGERTYRRKRYPCTGCWKFSITQEGEDDIAIISYEEIRIYFLLEDKEIDLFNITVKRQKDKCTVSSRLVDSVDFGRDLFGLWRSEYANKNKVAIHKAFTELLNEFGKQIKVDPDKSFLRHITPLDTDLASVVNSFRRLNEYNILPNVARSSVEQLPYAVMESDGRGVSEVIDALEKRTFHKIEFSISNAQEEMPYFDRLKHPAFFMSGRVFIFGPYPGARLSGKERGSLINALEKIQSELSAGVRPINEVATQIDQTNGKRFVVFRSDDDVFFPEEVSDGTIKWLCILVSIYVPNARIYLLEEPENFLHPWMQQRLIENMRIQAEESDTYYLLTSHSTTILNASYPQELRIVKPTENGTVIEDIPNIEEIEKALIESDFGLGDLWVSGAIEGVPTYEG